MDKKYEGILVREVEEIEELLRSYAYNDVLDRLEEMHPVDIAELIFKLDEVDQGTVIQILPWEKASEVLEEVNPETFNSLIKLFTLEQRRVVMDQMADDDIVDILSELPEGRREELISLLDAVSARDIQELLIYDEDSAGGIMTKDFVVLDKDMTTGEAIEVLRETAPDAQTIYYVFVVDQTGVLVGVLSLRELIVAKPNKRVEEIMDDKVLFVQVDDDQEAVAKMVSKYDLLAIPVVDSKGKIIGIITVDDVIDVIEEEATEDILKFAGSSESEYADEDGISERISNSVRARLPWLIITIFGGMFSAHIIKSFQYVLDANTTIALFMPVLAGMGGNVGTQSSTLTVRSIAMGQIQGRGVMKTIVHEVSVGMIVGVVSAVIAGLAATLLNGDVILALIVGLAMWANMVTAATIGTIVPLVFRKFGIDPAVASAPFITTTIDITGMTIYYTMASLMIFRLL
jgi:magnesium transporter